MSSKETILEYLQNQKNQASSPEVAEIWSNLLHLYTHKLWHQLTVLLQDFIPKMSSGRVELYKKFITDFEHSLSALSLVQMILHVLDELTDPLEALSLLKSVLDKVKLHPEAKGLCLSAIAVCYLTNNEVAECKERLQEAEILLENSDMEVGTVHAYYYKTSSEYYRYTGQHALYYKAALRYLGCQTSIKHFDKDSPPEFITTSIEADREHAFSLAIAAIIAEGVYNFGEILLHPILQTLKGDPDRVWVIDLLRAFNRGDIKRFEESRQSWSDQTDLKSNEIILQRKLRLLSLMELTFQRQATQRTLPFSLISEIAHVPVDEVEQLVMRAFSLGLVKGDIDEVDKVVHLRWVQPRVLDLGQVKSMSHNIKIWGQKIVTALDLLDNQVTQDLLV
ncbi:26S proteasome non-ATPase regulatory subunit 13 [Oopsacas minuta]|uniref:26S proteasome non-ATPase regulatory subunit 13 n=1 Tax=Oopsacas minuta TaxID=111878 RepID=A0AAV7KE54_9METZ|nr:26S proteasome non-ATPase regulatory subunit 13 [Oopsacas minuta]